MPVLIKNEEVTVIMFKERGRILITVAVLQMLLFGLIAAGNMGGIFLIARQVIAFICLALVPGYLILKIINIKFLNIVQMAFYSIGLSVAFLIILGFLTNTILPLFGIDAPLSLWPLYISYLIAFIVIAITFYVKSNELNNEKESLEMQSSTKIAPVCYLLLATLPIFSIIGVGFLDRFGSNLILILLFLIIALAVIILYISGKDKSNYNTLYAFALLCFSLSLLLHYFMPTNYIVGYDVNPEYHFANLVINMGYWNSAIWGDPNVVLSTVMLPVYFVKFMNIDLTWVFKLIFPMLFATVPVILYMFYSLDFDNRIAFLASFYFLSFYQYFMLSSDKQQVAELFLALFLVTVFNRTIPSFKRSLLAIIFAISLIVSHYGLSYIMSAFFILALWYSQIMSKIDKDKKDHIAIFTTTLLAIFIVLAITWYNNVGSSSGFIVLVQIGQKISETIFKQFSSVQAMDPLLIKAAGGVTESIWHKLSMSIYLATIILIIIGVGRSIYERIFTSGIRNKCCITPENEGLAIASLITMGLCVAVPYFASFLNMDRFYQIALFYLAPFCVYGGYGLGNIFDNFIRFKILKRYTGYAVLLLLILFYLFNNGVIYAVVRDTPQLMLDKFRMEQSRDPNVQSVLHGALINSQEYRGVTWLAACRDEQYSTYADYGDCVKILLSYGMYDFNQPEYLSLTHPLERNSYVYLGSFTVQDGYMSEPSKNRIRDDAIYSADENENIKDIDTVYNNGGSEILLK
jgi:uncharacterized membrane protein